MSHQEQYLLSVNSNLQSHNRPLKWLSYYRPTVTLNSSQYHFIAEPSTQKHQKVSLKNSESSRPMTMYLEVEDSKSLQEYFTHIKKEDHSKIKSFEYMEYVEKQQDEIILNREESVKSSLWAKEYEPKAFYQLLTDELHNRNVLTWLKSWDKIVFGREVAQIIPIAATKKFYGNNNIRTFPSGATGANSTNQPSTQYNNHQNPKTQYNNQQKPSTQYSNQQNPPTQYNNNQQKPTTTYNNQQKPYNNQPQYNHSRLLLLSGPPGCGKTTLARVVAKHCGYDVMELNASDDRSAKALIQKIESMGKNNSVLNNRPTMIVVDQVDGALEQDGNGIKEVLAYLQSGGKPEKEKTHGHNKEQRMPRPTDLPKTQPVHHQKHTIIPRPIIFICNDPFAKGLRELRSKAIVIYFRQVQKQRIIKRLKEITQKENIYIQNDVLTKIAEISNSDIRSSLSILQYLCHAKRSCNQNPKQLIQRLKLSLSKDSNQSILQFLSTIMQQPRRSGQKVMINLRQFSYNFSKVENPSLLIEAFFHNFILYKNFLVKKNKETLKMYELLKWCNVLLQQGFKYNNELDHFAMMVLLYYKMMIINEEMRKIEFPSGFFQRLNRQKHNKQIVHQLVSKWPTFLRSTISTATVIKQYLYVLYYSVQTASPKDADVLECVSRMITYGIELASRNAPHLFKPDFDSLLVYGQNRLEVVYSNISRTYIEESYQFAKLKNYLLKDMSSAELNKNTQDLMGQLDIRNRRRKRNPESAIRNSIKYKFIEGSGTQITYDLKFSYFF